MTLLVAKQAGDAIIGLADTKLSPEPNQAWSLVSQANKLVCLGNDWVIGYSGNVYAVDRVLRRISSEGTHQFSVLKALLTAANQESIDNGSPADFLLVATATLSMHKISDGQCQRLSSKNVWLGSKDAFEKYQELNHLPPNATHALLQRAPGSGSDGFDIAPQVIDESRKDIERRMDRIFKALIEDSNSPEVGGFPVSIVIHRGTPRYWPRAGRILSVPPGGLPADDLRNPVFGNAAYGDFQFDVIPAWEASQNTVAIYFREIRKALVFRRWEDGIPYAKLVNVESIQDPAIDLERQFGCAMWHVRVTQVGANRIEINADPPKAA